MRAQVLVGAVAAVALASSGPARADEKSAVAEVTELNKKALAAYEDLEVEEARKHLMAALQICATQGLQTHPVRARTHIHLGVVLAGGLNQREPAKRQFAKALEIQPDITITASLVNPELQALFQEARTELQAAESAKPPEPPVAKPEEKKPAEPPNPAPGPVVEGQGEEEDEEEEEDEGPPAGIKGVFHDPITTAVGRQTLEVRAAVEEGLAFARLVLAYRLEGGRDFLARDMNRQESGWYTARIPEPATRGKLVHYYIEARDKTGQPLAASGSAAAPHAITLTAAPPRTGPADAEDPLVRGGDEPPPFRFYVGLGLGSSLGYLSGGTELTPDDEAGDPIRFSGVAPTGVVVLAPEVGYLVSSRLMLSLALRVQFLSGLTSYTDPMTQYEYLPARGAFAALARATWFLTEGKLRPYVSGSIGGGEIRGIVSLDGLRNDCGPLDGGRPGTQACVDTVLGGMFLVGAGGGAMYQLGSHLLLFGNVGTLLGLPKLTFNFDFTAGVGVGF